MNHGKYTSEEYKEKQKNANDRRFGPILEHKKECTKCGKEYTFKGRLKTKAYRNSKFCSRSCANNRKDWWEENATHYSTIAFYHWDRKCAICEFDKIVVVHHIDHNRKNNDPINLIPLCPNHHEMFHSRYCNEVEPLIKEVLIKKWGIDYQYPNY